MLFFLFQVLMIRQRCNNVATGVATQWCILIYFYPVTIHQFPKFTFTHIRFRFEWYLAYLWLKKYCMVIWDIVIHLNLFLLFKFKVFEYFSNQPLCYNCVLQPRWGFYENLILHTYVLFSTIGPILATYMGPPI